MDHKISDEKLQLYFFNELSSTEKLQVEKHLQDCGDCRKKIEELNQLKTFLSLKKKDVPDTLLNEARHELRARIRIEKNKSTFGSALKEFFGSFKNLNPAGALTGIILLAAGIFAGYLLFGTAGSTENPILAVDSEEHLRITNVKFIDSDASDGEIEFTFDAVKPVKIKGDIKDEEIKSVLMHAMLNEENPGVRLNTVNFINESRSSGIDPEVKTAVITVAKFDENPGVRKEAFTFLKKIPFDEEIKEAYLYVLMNDSISGQRIEAMNGLFEASQKGELFSKEELSIFRKKMKADENSYIRLRAQTVLKEYN